MELRFCMPINNHIWGVKCVFVMVEHFIKWIELVAPTKLVWTRGESTLLGGRRGGGGGGGGGGKFVFF
jgi:hypothetical protein